MDGLDFQEIKKSELENEFTIGAEYYGKKYVESISVVKRQKKTIPLGQMWILATDGDHGSPDYQESGVLYLLSECVKEGYIEKAKCRYITEAKNRELKRSCLHPGDIVVTKTGVYFGKSAVIPESIPEANTIAHVGKITLKSQYNPYYVSTFLNCKYGYCQLRRRGIKATRPEIKLVEFPDIVIPEFSDRLYSAVEASVRKANTLLELASGTMELSAKLIIDSLAVGSSHAERVSKALVSFKNSFQLTGRLDAEYYQLKYKNYEAAVFGASNGYTFVKNEFVPVKKSCPRTLDNYNPHEVDPLAASNSYAIIYQVPFNGFGRLDRENIYATRRGEYAPLIATRAVEWFADYVYALRNALFHEIISPLDEEWQAIFKSAYLLLKQVSDICISCISQIDDFPQTQENAVFEYAEKHKAECFDQLADYVEILDFPEMTLSNWKIEKGRIALKGWFSAMLKLQQRNAEAIENGAGSITTECKGFDFSITLGDDFKIATDKETQKEIIEIKLQGS